MDTLDKALKPAYLMQNPNSSLVLLKSKLRLIKNKVTCEGNGQILIKWKPSPSISFKMNCDISHIGYSELPIGPAKLESAKNHTLSLDVFVKGINKSRDNITKIHGDIAFPRTIPEEPEECNEVKFHLINFINYFGSFIVDSSSLRTGRLTIDLQ